MYKKKTKRGKFKIRTNLQLANQDQTQRKSFIAKRQLQMMSFEFQDFPIDKKTYKSDKNEPRKKIYKKKNQKIKNEEAIRTTANSVIKEAITSNKEVINEFKDTKSRYLISGIQKGQKYSYKKREKQRQNKSKLSVNCVDFDTVRLKTRSEASIKLQELLKQKKKRMLNSKNNRFMMNTCRSNLSTLTQQEQYVSFTERQKQSRTFFTFNDAFDLIKRTKKQKMLTQSNESRIVFRETILRPELFKIIAKLKNNEERKKIKENNNNYSSKPQQRLLS